MAYHLTRGDRYRVGYHRQELAQRYQNDLRSQHLVTVEHGSKKHEELQVDILYHDVEDARHCFSQKLPTQLLKYASRWPTQLDIFSLEQRADGEEQDLKEKGQAGSQINGDCGTLNAPVKLSHEVHT